MKFLRIFILNMFNIFRKITFKVFKVVDVSEPLNLCAILYLDIELFLPDPFII